MMRSEELAKWIIKEAEVRGWSLREVARRGGLSHSAISNVANGAALAGWEFCIGISRALSVPADEVFRRAGLLPPLPPPVAEEQELLGIVRELLPDVRRIVLTMLRGLSRRPQTGDPVLDDIMAEYHRLSPDGRMELCRASKLIERNAHTTAPAVETENEEFVSQPTRAA